MIVNNQLTIGISELNPQQWRKLEAALTFEVDGDLVVSYRRLVTKGVYKLPRGAWSLVPDSIVYHDRRVCPKMPKLNFIPKLDDVEKDARFIGQLDAVKSMFEHEQGLIIRPPGTGKTAIALAFAALAQTRTLVLVHTEDILQQWIAAAKAALPDAKIGVIRGKTCTIGHITIATVQTLNRSYMEKERDWWDQFGAVIADEGHHVSAPSWEAVIGRCAAKYRFGFTASATRADGMHPTMQFIIGPIIHRMKFKSTVPLEVEPVKTDFRPIYRGPFDWMPLLKKLTEDEDRNRKVAEIADREIVGGNSILILSRRIDHLGNIADLMLEPSEILTGKRSRADRAQILKDFRSGKLRCLLSTQLADEALDVPRLNRVVLTFPGKHEGRLIQQIGRSLRAHPDKEDAKIYDIVDPVGVLKRQWELRRRTYKQNGISVKSTRRLFSRR
jgi:superfamily II DNA or RNA helicase